MKEDYISKLKAAARSPISNEFSGSFADLASKDNILKLIAYAETLRDGLEKAKEHCQCTRNDKGFDYGETHIVLGKPGPGKRWLTPDDVVDETLKQADSILASIEGV